MNTQNRIQFRSSVPLSDAARGKLVDQLDVLLANAIDAHLATKQAHWTLKGPFFFARHELFDQIAAHLQAQTDEIAERISTLGAQVRGTVQSAATNSGLKAYDTDMVDGRKHLEALVSRFASFGEALRKGISLADELDDPTTEDLLTETLRQLELDIWFLESHLYES